MQEEWKDIQGYEGLYQVSNQGRVRSLGMRFIRSNLKPYTRPPRFLKYHASKCGYLCVELCNHGYTKRYVVHRLVALAFIPNPNNLPEVNHKDEDKTNNCVGNLEWCTHKYNSTYGSRADRIKNTLMKTGRSKAVLMCDISGNVIRKFGSISEACREMKISSGSVVECCKGTRYRKTVKGYVWKYDQ